MSAVANSGWIAWESIGLLRVLITVRRSLWMLLRFNHADNFNRSPFNSRPSIRGGTGSCDSNNVVCHKPCACIRQHPLRVHDFCWRRSRMCAKVLGTCVATAASAPSGSIVVEPRIPARLERRPARWLPRRLRRRPVRPTVPRLRLPTTRSDFAPLPRWARTGIRQRVSRWVRARQMRSSLPTAPASTLVPVIAQSPV
jgi:hypothetical protein